MSASPGEQVDREKAELDRLWAKYADQGLLDEGIDQEGFTSFQGATVREVRPED
jgi:hypothetical protein